MASILYIVTHSRGRWWVDAESRQGGPHSTRSEAVAAAIEAAHTFGEPGCVIEVVAPNREGRYSAVWSSARDPYPPPASITGAEDEVSVEELRIAFQLTRDTIAGWSAEVVHYLEAADQAEDRATPDPETVAAAERALVAIRMEVEGLEDTAGRCSGKTDELVNGVAAAITEMGHLAEAITGAVARLRAVR